MRKDKIWFLSNDINKFFFQIQHKHTDECLDAIGSKGDKINVKMCHGLGGYQTFQYTKIGELRSETKCLFPDKKGQIKTIGCDFSKIQKWTYKPMDDDFGLFIHQEDGLCLTYSHDEGQKSKKSKSMLKFLSKVVTDLGRTFSSPTLNKCDEQDPKQLWAMNLASKWK